MKWRYPVSPGHLLILGDGVFFVKREFGIFHKMITESKWNGSCIWFAFFDFKDTARSQKNQGILAMEKFFKKNSFLKLNLSQYNGINFYTPWYICESCILISQLLKKHTHLRHLQLLSHQSCDISPSCTNPKIKEGQKKLHDFYPPNFLQIPSTLRSCVPFWPKVCLADSTDETPQSWFSPGFCSIFWYEEIFRRQAFYMAPNVFWIFQEMFISKNERCLNSRCLDFPVISREFSGCFCSMPRLSSKMPVAHGIWGKIEAACHVAFTLERYIYYIYKISNNFSDPNSENQTWHLHMKHFGEGFEKMQNLQTKWRLISIHMGSKSPPTQII